MRLLHASIDFKTMHKTILTVGYSYQAIQTSFGLCLLRLTARGWGTCQLKASQLQLSQKHSQLTIDTDIYYTHRLCLRHLT